jgi:hypothetical protein
MYNYWHLGDLEKKDKDSEISVSGGNCRRHYE